MFMSVCVCVFCALGFTNYHYAYSSTEIIFARSNVFWQVTASFMSEQIIVNKAKAFGKTTRRAERDGRRTTSDGAEIFPFYCKQLEGARERERDREGNVQRSHSSNKKALICL